MKTMHFVGVALLVAGTVAGYYFVARGTAPAEPQVAPVPVEGIAVRIKDVPLYMSGLGSVVPLQTVAVRTQVDGQINSIRFREGQHVHSNDVLVQIDPRELRAKLKEATGQLRRDQAALSNAEHDLKRYRGAQDTGTVTQQLIDTQAATVAQAKATVLADQGAIDEAKVKLGYCTIRSPLTGIAGLRQVDAGNLVRAADGSVIVTIVATTPIAVIFTLPERDIGRVAKILQRRNRIPVAALDADNRNILASGSIEALDNLVDPNSGTIKLKAIFKNAKDSLFPGQFVHARMLVGELKHVPVVPSHAVLHGSKGDYLFIVDHDGKAKIMFVKTGADVGGESPLLGGGVKAGDIVITDGAARVSEKANVRLSLVSVPKENLPASAASTDLGGSEAMASSTTRAHVDGATDANGGASSRNRMSQASEVDAAGSEDSPSP
ncbi:efflux RND transporter periplasmic adaptor subunit [Paraburkholderia caledonica]|uniref:Multidrug efflux system membrane fusion protein n=1 Tax=Paraburkholderia caledonica TaxID=134536 RepID=A0AB73IN73_9BURK|nr:multidrug efflux system membrane fusion protein [Paraburkholderia caledonica]